MTLCPQAWPMSGSASYSQQMAMASGPRPIVASKAVARPPTPRCTSKPPAESASAHHAAACDLLEAELRVRVDAVRQLDEACRLAVDDGLCALLLSRQSALARTHSITATMSPKPTVSPGLTRTSRTVPAIEARIGFSIFIASRTHKTSPAATRSPAATSTCTIVPCIGTVTVPSEGAVAPRA